jgi:hypothetical protein
MKTRGVAAVMRHVHGPSGRQRSGPHVLEASLFLPGNR